MKAVNAREYLTQREIDEFNQEKEVAQLQADYGLRVQELQLEVSKLEAKWTSLYRLPFAILMLPVRFMMSIALIISVAVKKELPQQFWDIINLK